LEELLGWQDLTNGVMKKCTDTFTTVVEYRRNGVAPGISINAVFDAPFVEGIALDGAPFASKWYRLGVRLADLPGEFASVKDTVYITATLYRVHEIRPDGEAGAVLHLHKVS